MIRSVAQRHRRTRQKTRGGKTDVEIQKSERRFRIARRTGRSRPTLHILALTLRLLPRRKNRRVADPARALVARRISWGHPVRLPLGVG